MQSFLGDAGKGGNALRKVTQREGVDNSLLRDRYAQAGPSSSQQPFRPSLGGPGHAPNQISSHPPQPFNLSHLSAALADPSVAGPAVRPASQQNFEQSWAASRTPQFQQHSPHQSARASPVPGGGIFASEFQARPMQQSNWAESFQTDKGKGRAADFAPSHQQHQPPYGGSVYGGYQPQMGYQPSFTPMYSGYNQQQIQPSGQMQQPPMAAQGPEIEQAFERAMADWKAMADTSQETTDKETTDTQMNDGIEDRGEMKGDLERVWESLKPEAERLNQLAEWEKEFSQFANDQDDLFDQMNGSLNHADVETDDIAEAEEGFWHPHEETSRAMTPQDEAQMSMNELQQKRRTYQFTLPNRFDSLDPEEAWTEANHLLQSGGSLADATLLLETYIRRGADMNLEKPSTRQVEAWALLGNTHAMNEKEEKALSAFEEGRRDVEGNEQSPHVGELLTNLAISLVNESDDLEALQVLHQFLTLLHPEHAGTAPTREAVDSRANPWAVHQEVTNQFLALARDQYNRNNQVDPDVQVGLGTLYYMMGEYTEARDCWVAALGERPDDYLLWNRLGATLANGGSPEEAVNAYRRALELKPLFTRATFNLGVACLNIGVHKEAAEHFLGALSLHAKDAEREQKDSTPIWLTLRRALIAMDMLELSGMARPGADLENFRRAGFDF